MPPTIVQRAIVRIVPREARQVETEYRTCQQGPLTARQARLRRKPRAEPAKSWVEFELDDGPWTVTCGFVAHGDELVLADLRVFPTRDTPAERGLNPNERNSDDGRDWGDWSWDPDLVPTGGLTMRTVRALRVGDAVRAALTNVPEPGSYLENAGFIAARRLTSKRAHGEDRRRRPPELLARVALVYEKAVAAGKHPGDSIYQELSGARQSDDGAEVSWSFERSTVPSLVRAARAAGYLTPAIKGRAYGKATDAARDLLKR